MRHILVVRACAIGDFVLNLPALQALSQTHAQCRFSLVGYPSRLDIAREFVAIEKIYSIDSAPWSRLFYEPISALKFDSAIVWMKDPVFASNLRRSGVREVLQADPFPSHGHAAAHLLRTLNLPAPPLPNMWRPESDDIIVHSSSGSPRKNWPYFAELMERLGDRALLLREAREAGEGKKFRTLENVSLRQVINHLKGCRAYIGNDSGITHMAAYMACPTAALFGPTNPRVWGPIGRRSRIIWKTKLEDISVDEVLLALQWKTQSPPRT